MKFMGTICLKKNPNTFLKTQIVSEIDLLIIFDSQVNYVDLSDWEEGVVSYYEIDLSGNTI